VALPWLHEALRRKHSIEHLSDCEKCMEQFDTTTRRYMGCGWEQPIDGARPWSPENLNADWKAPTGKVHLPVICVGYTSKLPEVIEIARARVHAKEFGGLSNFCDERPTEHLRIGIEILEGASNETQNWSMSNPEKK
jgi:hypothetical protein